MVRTARCYAVMLILAERRRCRNDYELNERKTNSITTSNCWARLLSNLWLFCFSLSRTSSVHTRNLWPYKWNFWLDFPRKMAPIIIVGCICCRLCSRLLLPSSLSSSSSTMLLFFHCCDTGHRHWIRRRRLEQNKLYNRASEWVFSVHWKCEYDVRDSKFSHESIISDRMHAEWIKYRWSAKWNGRLCTTEEENILIRNAYGSDAVIIQYSYTFIACLVKWFFLNVKKTTTKQKYERFTMRWVGQPEGIRKNCTLKKNATILQRKKKLGKKKLQVNIFCTMILWHTHKKERRLC